VRHVHRVDYWSWWQVNANHRQVNTNLKRLNLIVSSLVPYTKLPTAFQQLPSTWNLHKTMPRMLTAQSTWSTRHHYNEQCTAMNNIIDFIIKVDELRTTNKCTSNVEWCNENCTWVIRSSDRNQTHTPSTSLHRWYCIVFPISTWRRTKDVVFGNGRKFIIVTDDNGWRKHKHNLK